MNQKKAALVNIGISILFAAAIIVSAFLLKGTQYQQTVTWLLIAVWWIPFSWLGGRACTSCRAR